MRAGHFNYVRVFDAGHMINENKAVQAKYLFETWVFNRNAFAEYSP
jgi:carboxypeptidase C (cathepsin A)